MIHIKQLKLKMMKKIEKDLKDTRKIPIRVKELLILKKKRIYQDLQLRRLSLRVKVLEDNLQKNQKSASFREGAQSTPKNFRFNKISQNNQNQKIIPLKMAQILKNLIFCDHRKKECHH